MADRPLSVIAAEVAAETGGRGDASAERAETIAREIRLERPDVKARSAIDAARRTLGLPTVAAETADAVGGDGRARRGAGRVARRTARRAVPRGLVRTGAAVTGQVMGLLLLYWLLRNATAIGRLSDALTGALDWLVSTAPIGGNKTP